MNNDLTFTLPSIDPPTPVKPRVVDIGSSSLRLAWQTDNLNPVEGFIINYRTDNDEWIDRTAMGTLDGFTLTGLRCGTRYQITVTAFNKVGKSEPSEPLVVSTAGSGKNSLANTVMHAVSPFNCLLFIILRIFGSLISQVWLQLKCFRYLQLNKAPVSAFLISPS